MLAELFEKVFQRLDTRHQPKFENLVDPKDSAQVVGYFNKDGSFQQVMRGPATKGFKFPKVSVFSAKSLVDYAKHHASGSIEEGSAFLRVNKEGLFLTVDYGAQDQPEERDHNVAFRANFDEECEAAAAAIVGALGKWITLDQFDALLDKCAPFIANFTQLEEAASNMEGHETAKIAKTATSFQVQVQGEVTCAVDIPKVVKVQLMFMGNPIAAEIPLRLTVESKQVKFHLVDNGAIAKARMEVLKLIKAQVVEQLPGLLVIDGSIA